MSLQELAQWQAYYSVDPFDEQRMDMRFAMLAMLVAAFGGKKKSLKDFLLFPEKQPVRKESPAKMIQKLKMMGAWFRGNNRSSQGDAVVE